MDESNRVFFTSVKHSLSLQHLKLRGNPKLNLDQLVQCLRTLPNLVVLDLSYSCQGQWPMPLLSCLCESSPPQLTSLNLSGWTLADASVYDLEQTGKICNALASALLSLENLVSLYLNGCVQSAGEFSDVFCSAMGSTLRIVARTLHTFEFQANALADSRDSRSFIVWSFQRARILDFSSTCFNSNDGWDKALEASLQIKCSLHTLRLSGCRTINDAGIDKIARAMAFGSLEELKVLGLDDCRISEEALQRIAHNLGQQVEELSVAFNPGSFHSMTNPTQRSPKRRLKTLCMDSHQGELAQVKETYFPTLGRGLVWQDGGRIVNTNIF